MKTTVTTKVKSLIKGEVSMGTYGLVELEVRALEQSNTDLLESLELATKRLNQITLSGNLSQEQQYILLEEIKGFNTAIKKATK